MAVAHFGGDPAAVCNPFVGVGIALLDTPGNTVPAAAEVSPDFCVSRFDKGVIARFFHEMGTGFNRSFAVFVAGVYAPHQMTARHGEIIFDQIEVVRCIVRIHDPAKFQLAVDDCSSQRSVHNCLELPSVGGCQIIEPVGLRGDKIKTGVGMVPMHVIADIADSKSSGGHVPGGHIQEVAPDD